MIFILPYGNSDLPIGKNGTVHTLLPKKKFSSYRKRKRNDESPKPSANNRRTNIDDLHGYINPYNDTRRALPFYGFILQVQISFITYIGYHLYI